VQLFGFLAFLPLRGLNVSPIYYYVGLGLLFVALLFAVVKAYRVWEEIHDVEDPDSPADLLDAFKDAHAAGELDDAEFARVRERLSSPPAQDAATKAAVAQDHPNPMNS
jgi:hypothetical protein